MTDTVKRTAELREMLRGRRREMHVEVRSRLRTERSGRTRRVLIHARTRAKRGR